MVAADLMTPDPITVTESTSLRSVHERMQLARIRHMPVIRGTKLVGLVTHRDVLSASLSKLADVDGEIADELLSQIPVGEVMVRDPVTVHAETPLVEAIHIMLQRKFGCLPVVDDADAVVGILTESDFLKLTRSLLEATQNGNGDE